LHRPYQLSDFDYDLPADLIAKEPTKKRDSSHLLVVNNDQLIEKQFSDIVDNIDKNSSPVLKIGSIIGLDTEMARKLGQGTLQDAFSSPTSIYVNSQKIGELQINGDGQKVPIPAQLLIPKAFNQITIKTGQNMFVSTRTDYDDMEFMNLILEFK